MNWYTDCKLTEDPDGGYTLEIQLNKNLEEFSKENLSEDKEEALKLDERIKKLIAEKFGGLKINGVKLLLGTVVVASLPFLAATPVQAAATSVTAQQTANEVGTVTASQLNVRSGPSSSYGVIHTLWKGNQVTVIGLSGNWFQIKLSSGATGWVSADYLSTMSATGTVTASRLNVRSGASTDYGVTHTLWQGNQVTVFGKYGSWYHIRMSSGATGWVSASYLSVSTGQSQTNQQKIDTVVSTAKNLIGTPYVFGGESPSTGFDCSGFVYYVYKQAGYELNRISSDQVKNGIGVSWANRQPGDLVFFSINQDGKVDHVGIYIGNGQMIHSPKAGDTVKTTDITTSYWQSRFVTARRIIY